MPNGWDHGLVPVFFSIPLGGGALDVGNPQVGRASSFLYGAKIGQRPHFDHGLYSRANPRVVSADAFDSADSSADVLQTRVHPTFQALVHAWTWLFCWCLLKICFRISMMIKRARKHMIKRFLSLHYSIDRNGWPPNPQTRECFSSVLLIYSNFTQLQTKPVRSLISNDVRRTILGFF